MGKEPDDKGGHELSSIGAITKAEHMTEHEREQIDGFLRYVEKKCNSERQEDLVRGIREDIRDAKHLKECYQR